MSAVSQPITTLGTYECSGEPERMAKIALEHKLYDPKGTLKGHFTRIAKQKTRETAIALFYVGSKPIAVATCTSLGMLSVWVNPEHRGKGYGKRVVTMARITRGIDMYRAYALRGEDEKGSKAFWKSMGIYVGRYYWTIPQGVSARNRRDVANFIAHKKVGDMRKQGISAHYMVDDYIISQEVTVEGYTPRAVPVYPKEK